MVFRCHGYGAVCAKSKIEKMTYDMRDMTDEDVIVEVKYCGICHSDIHQVENDWGEGIFPMVPGHEIIGNVAGIGKKVDNFKIGDLVGIGCFVDSCRNCNYCKTKEEQVCNKLSVTYNGLYQDGSHTYGGYGSHITIHKNFLYRLSHKLDRPDAAPLLCAGITVYSPMVNHNMTKFGSKIAVVGLGGLGHMAVKFGAAFGCDVTVISTSKSKESSAISLGAKSFVLSSDLERDIASHQGLYDGVIDTVCVKKDLDLFVRLLKPFKSYVLLGIPETKDKMTFTSAGIITKSCQIAGSVIAGTKQTQEMLDFCAEKDIFCDIELIRMEDINEAYERIKKSDVKYRFVMENKKCLHPEN